MSKSRSKVIGTRQTRRAWRRAPIEKFPEPKWSDWDDPANFSEALDLHMRRHGDGSHRLRSAIVAPGDILNGETVRDWRSGKKEPRSVSSLEMLARIEARYRLPAGYFRSKLSHPARAWCGFVLPGVKASEQ